MDLFGVNGWEMILLVLIAVFVLGPERLPEYAAKLARGIRKLRVMAEGAKDQLKDQLGPEYEDIDWRQYDPRQYDPRRIVREALQEPLDSAVGPIRDEIGAVRTAAGLRAAGTAAGAAAATTAPDVTPADVTPVEPVYDDVPAWRGPVEWDPTRPTPFDVDAT